MKQAVTAQGFSQVIPRFDMYLQKKAKWLAKYSGPLPGSSDNGILIIDRDYANEVRYAELLKDFRTTGHHHFGVPRHVIEVPFFADSKEVAGLQLADIAAFAVRRHVDKPDSERDERTFRTLLPFFDRDPAGKLHGIRHYVPGNTCKCLVCRERGHTPGE